MTTRDNILKRWLRDAFNEYAVKPIGIDLIQLERRLRNIMASQEERLKAIEASLVTIAAGIQTLKDQLATLKGDNPEIEDEITAIEQTVTGMGAALAPPASVEPPTA